MENQVVSGFIPEVSRDDHQYFGPRFFWYNSNVRLK